jgi:hypothetical protein
MAEQPGHALKGSFYSYSCNSWQTQLSIYRFTLARNETGAASNTSQPAAAGLLINLLYMFIPNDEHRLIGMLQSRRPA